MFRLDGSLTCRDLDLYRRYPISDKWRVDASKLGRIGRTCMHTNNANMRPEKAAGGELEAPMRSGGLISESLLGVLQLQFG